MLTSLEILVYRKGLEVGVVLRPETGGVPGLSMPLPKVFRSMSDILRKTISVIYEYKTKC